VNNEILQLGLYFTTVVLGGWVLSKYMHDIFEGRIPKYARPILCVERGIYRLLGRRSEVEMDWKCYAFAMLFFNGFGALVTFVCLYFQSYLPLNTGEFADIPLEGAFNIAASFVTNTNWQWYGGESTLSHFSQMVALTVQNFLSAASGMAVLLVLTRGFIRNGTKLIGNFWEDITRTLLYVLALRCFMWAVGD